MRTDAVVSVDLGGTNLRLGAVTASGKVLLRRRVRMGAYRRKRELLEDLHRAIRAFSLHAGEAARIRAVCIGFAGYTDTARGLVYFAPNVGGLSNIDAGPYLGRRLRAPVFIENDANCAALGEYDFGAGRGARSLFMFTLGTGVGGGFIINGAVWHGSTGIAGEIGHIVIAAGGRKCSCGARGCLEAYASATALVRDYRRRKGIRGGMGKALTARQVAGLAKEGDSAALAAVNGAAGALGLGIANVFNLLNPEVILIGGGLSRAGSILLKPALERAGKTVFPPLASKLKVKRARLGDDAALLGAASLAFSRMGRGKP